MKGRAVHILFLNGEAKINNTELISICPIAMNVTDIRLKDSKYISVPKQKLFTCKVGLVIKMCGFPSSEDSKCGLPGYHIMQSDTY
jgi:hypothetical protein